jgi:hypothetical protein
MRLCVLPAFSAARACIEWYNNVMEFALLVWLAVGLVGICQIMIPYKPLPPLTPEQIEWRETMDYHIANSSSEDS